MKSLTTGMLTVIGLSVAICLAGCATLSDFSSFKKQREVLVEVVRPSQMEEGGCKTIHLVYLSPEKVLSAQGVHVSYASRQMIAEEIRRLLNETGYIKSTTVPSDLEDADYHDMIVKVTSFEVKSSQQGNYRRKTAFVDLSLVLKEGGLQECYSITPPVSDHTAQVPIHRDQSLPSDQVLLRQAVRHALEDVVSTFVPKKVPTLRPVHGLSGPLTRSSDLLLAGNCQDALVMLKQHLTPNGGDPQVLYNAGVAAECVATQERNQKRKGQALEVSVNYYKQALALGATDVDLQRARREAQQTLDFYQRIRASSADQRQHREQYKSPKGF